MIAAGTGAVVATASLVARLAFRPNVVQDLRGFRGHKPHCRSVVRYGSDLTHTLWSSKVDLWASTACDTTGSRTVTNRPLE